MGARAAVSVGSRDERASGLSRGLVGPPRAVSRGCLSDGSTDDIVQFALRRRTIRIDVRRAIDDRRSLEASLSPGLLGSEVPKLAGDFDEAGCVVDAG
jgi:hypothetical protein